MKLEGSTDEGAAVDAPALATFLVATSFDDASAIALRRADAVARMYRARMFVLHVVAPPRWIDGLFTRHDPSKELWEAAQATQSFCRKVLGRPLPPERVIVTQGVVASSILLAADHLGASIIIVGGGARAHHARVAGRVLRAADRPVLVARAPTGSGAILVASDLSERADPALAQGADLAAHLHAPVTFLHNVRPARTTLPVSSFDAPRVLELEALPDAMAQRAALLRDLARHFDGQIDTLVLACDSATQAILETAQQRDVDVVVVGHHHRGVIQALFGAATAESLVARTERSVLAVPLHDNEPQLAA